MQIYCFALAVLPVHAACAQGINAVGRSDLFLKMSVVKTVCSLLSLVMAVALFESPIAIAQVAIFTTVINCIVNAVPCREYIGYRFKEQITDLLPASVISAVMLGVISLVGKLELSAMKRILAQVTVGMVVYLLLSIFLRVEAFFQLWQHVKYVVHVVVSKIEGKPVGVPEE